MSKGPARFTWTGVTPQLFLVVVLPLTLLLLLTTFGGLRLHQLSMRSLVGERDERAVRAAANALKEQIAHRVSVLHSLAYQISLAPFANDEAKILQQLTHFSPDFDLGLAVFNSQDQFIMSSGSESFWQLLDIASVRSSSHTLMKEKQVEFYSLTVNSVQEPVIVLLTSQPQGGFISAGAFSPSLSIEPVLSDVFNPSAGRYAFVIDSDRQVLYQIGDQPDTQESLADHVGVAEALHGQTGSTFVKLIGDEHVVAYSPVETVGWALVIEEPWDVVASPLLRLTEYAPLVLFPILLLALLAIWFGTSRIVQPLHQLEERASALGWGDYESIHKPVGGIAEIRYLQEELIQLSEKVQMAQQGLRGYIRGMTRGLEEERRKLARELHDDTLQSIIALNQRIHLARLNENNTKLDQGYQEIQAIAEKTIQDLRRTARTLRPIYLEDLGLAAALEMLTQETHTLHGLETTYHLDGTEQRLPDEIELALYRMVQEAFTNVLRHAQAVHLSLSVSFSAEELTLLVEDDGMGFDLPDSPSSFALNGHYGLLGMYERAELIGASLTLQSEPGRGTRIHINLPISG